MKLKLFGNGWNVCNMAIWTEGERDGVKCSKNSTISAVQCNEKRERERERKREKNCDLIPWTLGSQKGDRKGQKSVRIDATFKLALTWHCHWHLQFSFCSPWLHHLTFRPCFIPGVTLSLLPFHTYFFSQSFSSIITSIIRLSLSFSFLVIQIKPFLH